MNKPNSQVAPTLARFRDDARGAVSVETIIILPLLLWALVATVVFFDAFRTRHQVQTAALTVADIVSRETDMLTTDYLEGMNDVFDFLANSRRPTRLRISSVIWDSSAERNRLQWSYGTRGLAPLPENLFALLNAESDEPLYQAFGGDDSFSFSGTQAQMPVPDFNDRIPPVLPGEAVVVVESFAMWSPFVDVGLARRRISHVVATRPRFTPWIHLEGTIPVFPEDAYEMVGYDIDDDPHAPEPPEEPLVCNQPGDPGCPTGSEVLTDMDFENGATGGWSRGSISDGGSAGRFLGPFGGETFDDPVRFNVHLGAPAVSAVIDFDLFVIDSWDGYSRQWADRRGDNMTLMIDGTPISLDVFQHDFQGVFRNTRLASGTLEGMRYTVEMEPISHGTDFYGAHWPDQIWRVTVTLQGPPWQFDFALSASLDQDIHDESFGIGRFRVTANYGTPADPGFSPDPASRQGEDHHTRFPVHAGCPDPRIGAPWLTVFNTDLLDALLIERRAGGSTRLESCAGIDGWGWVHASPHLVLRYDNEGQRGAQRRLRIRMDDDNSGRSCDTTLLLHDPNGQWWFNDDIHHRHDWNARLNLGHAESGDYHIWIGSWAGNSCDADLIIERY
ncbi:MAG: pilus assembly protein [Pararhodobacter sp.]|nr:pilus assembly protein [Pararhodobacter sp.]